MSTPTRCLIITQRLFRSGVETFIMNVLKNLDRDKLMFDFYLDIDCKDGYYQEALELGCKIYVHTKRRKNFFAYKKELDTFFRKHASAYRAVYFHGNSFTCIAPIDYAKKYGIPIRILHCHSSTTSGLHNILFHYFNRLRIKHVANKFFACSESARQWGYKGTSALQESRVIKNGIDLRRYSFNIKRRKTIREKLCLNEKIVIGMVGRLTHVKNPSFAVEIMTRLQQISDKYCLLFIGDGVLREPLEIQVKDRELHNRVIFMGNRDDVPDLMQGMDLLIMPSYYEGLPFVLVEAQSAGLPIIASNNISEEVRLSEHIQFLRIDSGVEEWVNAILSIKHKRKECFIDQRLTSYDIRSTALKIENTILESQ